MYCVSWSIASSPIQNSLKSTCWIFALLESLRNQVVSVSIAMCCHDLRAPKTNRPRPRWQLVLPTPTTAPGECIVLVQGNWKRTQSGHASLCLSKETTMKSYFCWLEMQKSYLVSLQARNSRPADEFKSIGDRVRGPLDWA